jgi:hypothetical protein
MDDLKLSGSIRELSHTNGVMHRRRRHSRWHDWWERALMALLQVSVGLLLLLLPVATTWLLVRMAEDIVRVLGSWR